jgi:hypothetical protein
MLNTIPEAAQTSHSRKCSNNTEHGKYILNLARSVFGALETVSMTRLFKVVLWHIDMQGQYGVLRRSKADVDIGIFHYHK